MEDLNIESQVVTQTVSQTLLLENNYHKQFLTINQKKSNTKLAILNGNDDRFFVSSNDMLIVDDTAFIPISGVLLHSSDETCIKGWWTDYNFLHKQIQSAYNNDSITRVVFNVDSPGGMCLGMDAIASEIKELSLIKETIAIVHGLCCSASYMLSANCTKIYATQGSIIGAIGVFTLLIDDKEYFEKMGLKIYSVGQPHGKTLGRPGQEVTEEYLQKVQTECDEIFENIVDTVSSKVNREKIMELDADTFTPQVALSHGLIDGILTAEQTLTNTFPKEEIMPDETTSLSTLPPTTPESSPPASEQSGTVDMQALFSGITEAVKEGVSQAVSLSTIPPAMPSASEGQTSEKTPKASIEDLPAGGLGAFQTGAEAFENSDSNSSQADNIRAAFSGLASSNTTPKELYVKVQEGNNA